MNKQEAELGNITIYWWNGGTKTLDFRGTVKDYLKKKGGTVRRISHNIQKDIKGYRLKMTLSSARITIDSFDPDYTVSVNNIIRTFLMLLGDKTIYHDPYGRVYKINWG